MRTQELDTPVLAEAPETPVFLGARRRVTWLRAAGVAIGTVVVLWLVALVAGILGFGNVTGLSLPGLAAAKKPVLHRTAVPVTAALGGSRATSDARRKSSTSISLRARGTPSRSRGRSRVVAGRRARGQGRSSAPRRATKAPSPSAPPSAGTVHGKHLGNGGSGTSSPSTSNSHRAGAPGQQRTSPAASVPSSPNARRNRRLDHESMWPLWRMPLQQFVYRQLMYMVVIESVISALLGIRVRWQHVERRGGVKATA